MVQNHQKKIGDIHMEINKNSEEFTVSDAELETVAGGRLLGDAPCKDDGILIWIVKGNEHYFGPLISDYNGSIGIKALRKGIVQGESLVVEAYNSVRRFYSNEGYTDYQIEFLPNPGTYAKDHNFC